MFLASDFLPVFWQYLARFLAAVLARPGQISGNVCGEFSGPTWPDFWRAFWIRFWRIIFWLYFWQFFLQFSSQTWPDSLLCVWSDLTLPDFWIHFRWVFFRDLARFQVSFVAWPRFLTRFLASFLARPAQVSGYASGPIWPDIWLQFSWVFCIDLVNSEPDFWIRFWRFLVKPGQSHISGEYFFLAGLFQTWLDSWLHFRRVFCQISGDVSSKLLSGSGWWINF